MSDSIYEVTTANTAAPHLRPGEVCLDDYISAPKETILPQIHSLYPLLAKPSRCLRTAFLPPLANASSEPKANRGNRTKRNATKRMSERSFLLRIPQRGI